MVDEDLLLDKIKAIDDKIDSVQDVEKLTELDIINLKNEIEKLKIGTNAFIPEDIEERVVKIEKLADNADVFEEWKKSVNEIKAIRKIVDNLSKGVPAGSSNLRDEIKSIKNAINSKSAKTPEYDYSKEISEIVHRIDSIEQNVRSIKPVRIPRIPEDVNKYSDSINDINERLNTTILDLEKLKKKSMSSDSKPLPPIGIDVDKLKNSVSSLQIEIDSIKKSIGKDKTDDIKSRIDALDAKIDKISSEKNEQATNNYNKEISSLRRDIESLSLSLEVMPTAEDITRINTITDKTQNEIKNIKSLLNSKKQAPSYVKDINSLKKDVENLSKTVNDISGNLSHGMDFENAIDKRIMKIENSIKNLSMKRKETTGIGKIRNDILSLNDALKNTISKKEFEEFEANLLPPQIPTSKDIQSAFKKGIKLENEIKEINKKAKKFELFLERKDELDQLSKSVQKHSTLIENLAKGMKKNQKMFDDYKNMKKSLDVNSNKVDNVMNELRTYIKSQSTKPPAAPSSLPDKKVAEIFERIHQNENDAGNTKKSIAGLIKEINDMRSAISEKRSTIPDKRMDEMYSKINDNEQVIGKLIDNVKSLSSSLKTVQTPSKSVQNEKDVTKTVDRMSHDMNIIKKTLEQKFDENNAREFENDIYKELETMNRGIKKALDENKEYMKKVSVDVSNMNDRILQIEKKSDNSSGLNIENIARDMEAVKAKQKWIENNVEHFNIDPLHEKLSELERKINSLKVSSPMVIE